MARDGTNRRSGDRDQRHHAIGRGHGSATVDGERFGAGHAHILAVRTGKRGATAGDALHRCGCREESTSIQLQPRAFGHQPGTGIADPGHAPVQGHAARPHDAGVAMPEEPGVAVGLATILDGHAESGGHIFRHLLAVQRGG